MQDEGSGQIVRYRTEFRAALLALGVPLIGIGIWALVAPRSWFDEFPGGGVNWVTAFGSYNEHLVRDLAGALLALGLLLAFAAILLERRLVQAALGAQLVFAVPHLGYHATELGALSTADNVANIATLAFAVVLPAVLLWLSVRPDAPRAKTKTTTIEPEATYGTR